MRVRSALTPVFAMVALAALAWQIDTAKGETATNGLISYWTFDEVDTAGKTVKDIWGDSDGTIVGDPGIVEGKFGEGVKPGIGAYVQFDDSKMSSGNAPRTLSAWVNAQMTGQFKAVVEWGTNVATQRCGILINPANQIYFVGAFADMASNGTIEADTWSHVTITYDGAAMNIYINGELDTEGAPGWGGQALKLDTKLSIGRIGANVVFTENFSGIIDEVSIYDRALSAEEVKQNSESEGFELAAVDPAGKLALTWGEVKVSR